MTKGLSIKAVFDNFASKNGFYTEGSLFVVNFVLIFVIGSFPHLYTSFLFVLAPNIRQICPINCPLICPFRPVFGQIQPFIFKKRIKKLSFATQV
jgi:hypothetical protein